MLLADQDSEDLHTCLSHVQRALALVPVLQKSNPSDSVVRSLLLCLAVDISVFCQELEDKLLKKQEELQEELLEESPLGTYIKKCYWMYTLHCVLHVDVCDGEESVPELHSTPTLSMKRKVCNWREHDWLGQELPWGNVFVDKKA